MIRKKITILFWGIFFVSHLSIAQQIEFDHSYKESLGMKPGFNNRFYGFYQSEVSFGDAAFYKSKKVKSITVYGERKNKLYSFDLDTNGKVLKTGVQEYYFKTSENYFDKDSLYCSVRCYWQGDILVRTDTNKLKQMEWKRNDTLLFCSKRELRTNKIGYLLNEQNRYYNEQYLSKKIKLKNPPIMIYMEGDDYTKPRIYLKKPFKTDYDSLKMYATFSYGFIDNKYGSAQNGKQEIDLNAINDGFYCKNCDAISSMEYFIEGENFDEPTEYIEPNYCGSHYYRIAHWNDGISYKFDLNEKGLRTKQYLLYYREDTSTPEPTKESKASNEVQIIAHLPENTVRRVSTPTEQLINTIEYTYYE